MTEKMIIVYKMIRSGIGGWGSPIEKFGITTDPKRRERENASQGFGNTLVEIARHRSHDHARAREKRLIDAYEQRTGRRPQGNP